MCFLVLSFAALGLGLLPGPALSLLPADDAPELIHVARAFAEEVAELLSFPVSHLLLPLVAEGLGCFLCPGARNEQKGLIHGRDREFFNLSLFVRED